MLAACLALLLRRCRVADADARDSTRLSTPLLVSNMTASVRTRRRTRKSSSTFLRHPRNPRVCEATRASYAFFAFFDTREARVLRRVCRDYYATPRGSAHPLKDMHAGIKDLALWPVATFPAARCARIRPLTLCSGRPLDNGAFALLAGIRELDMTSCDQPGITDAAFRHLRGRPPAQRP